MEILGIKFAPLYVPLRRRLETLAAGVWIFIMAFGMFLGYVITAILFFYSSTLRYIIIVYMLWMYFYDLDTCYRGGRSNAIVNWVRNCAWFRYFCSYFPAKLVKTVDLDPNRNYLMCVYPHGIFSAGCFCAFTTDVLGCKDIFPGLDFRIVILDQHFKIPLFREYCYFCSCISSSSESINYALSTKPEKPYTGRGTLLIVGGAQESFESVPGAYRVILKKRKGFIRIALKNGSPIVPVCSFGETDIFDQIYGPPGSRFRRIQECIRKKMGIAPIMFKGRGFFQYSFGFIPRRRPITVVVGSPMEVPKIEEPTQEQIDEYHEKFTKCATDLFEAHKHKYVKNADSVFLEMVT